MNWKKVLAYVFVGVIAPIVGNAADVSSQVIGGASGAAFTFGNVVTPALPAMIGTIPAVLAALLAESPKKKAVTEAAKRYGAGAGK